MSEKIAERGLLDKIVFYRSRSFDKHGSNGPWERDTSLANVNINVYWSPSYADSIVDKQPTKSRLTHVLRTNDEDYWTTFPFCFSGSTSKEKAIVKIVLSNHINGFSGEVVIPSHCFQCCVCIEIHNHRRLLRHISKFSLSYNTKQNC